MKICFWSSDEISERSEASLIIYYSKSLVEIRRKVFTDYVKKSMGLNPSNLPRATRRPVLDNSISILQQKPI